MNEQMSGFSYLLEAWIKYIFCFAFGVDVVDFIYNTNLKKKSMACLHDVSCGK